MNYILTNLVKWIQKAFIPVWDGSLKEKEYRQIKLFIVIICSNTNVTMRIGIVLEIPHLPLLKSGTQFIIRDKCKTKLSI